MQSLTTRTLGLMALFAALGFGGCTDGSGAADAGSRACYAPLDANAGVVCPQGDAGPCEIIPACDDDLWNPEPLPNRPWWLRHPPSACLEHVAHGTCEVPEALDDCPPIPTFFDSHRCPIPSARGASCADGNHWTQTCHTSADCPRGMGCVIGYEGPIHDTDSVEGGSCQQRCGADGDPICVRCGFVCGADAYCVPAPPPPGPPCDYDCDCLGETLCFEGECREVGIPFVPGCEMPDVGGDLAPLACPCTGGTCEINATTGRGCCRAPDGHIAPNNSDPICR